MNYIDCEQGSRTWFDVRLGCVGSSRVDDAISYLKRKSKNGDKGDESAGRKNLKIELVCELLTGKPSEHYVSKWMEWGKEMEPVARAAYEIISGVDCWHIGFGFHPTIKMAGASPDGLIGNDGIVEFKCPKTSTHIKYLMAGVVPEEYRPQCYWLMASLEREWCDFVSHDPTIKNQKIRTFIAPRLYRDEEIIQHMEREVEKLNQEVEEILLKINPDYIEERLARSLELIK